MLETMQEKTLKVAAKEAIRRGHSLRFDYEERTFEIGEYEKERGLYRLLQLRMHEKRMELILEDDDYIRLLDMLFDGDLDFCLRGKE